MFLSPVFAVPTVAAGSSLASARGYPAVVLSGSASAWLEQPARAGDSITANAGSGFVDNCVAGDSITASIAAAVAMVDDGTGHAVALRQGIEEGGNVNVSNIVRSITGEILARIQNWPTTQSITGNTLTTVSNLPAVQSVSGTFWQATQPVSGSFYPAVQSISGQVWANFPAVLSVSGQVFANQNGAPWDVRKVGLVKEHHDTVTLWPPSTTPTLALFSLSGALVATLTMSWSGENLYRVTRS